MKYGADSLSIDRQVLSRATSFIKEKVNDVVLSVTRSYWWLHVLLRRPLIRDTKPGSTLAVTICKFHSSL